jgi:hypothetical protein
MRPVGHDFERTAEPARKEEVGPAVWQLCWRGRKGTPRSLLSLFHLPVASLGPRSLTALHSTSSVLDPPTLLPRPRRTRSPCPRSHKVSSLS